MTLCDIRPEFFVISWITLRNLKVWCSGKKKQKRMACLFVCLNYFY